MGGPPAFPMLLSRLIVLAVVVALAQLWVSHHLGWGSDTPWIAGLLFVVAAASKFVGLVLSKDRKEALERQVQQALEPVVTGWFPILICAAAVVVALLLSSVTVVPGSDVAASGNAASVRLLTVEGGLIAEQPLGSGQSPARFTWVRTSPFGRPYRLAADGYVDEAITVYPLIGLNVTPDRDLRRSPSLLFRPSIRGVQTLKSEGAFIVMWYPSAGPPRNLVPLQRGLVGSVLLGRNQSIPVSFVAMWRLELSSSGVQEATVSEMIVGWSRPRVLTPAVALAPGMKVVAEIRTRTNVAIDRAEVVLGTDPLIDVPLLGDAGGG